MTLKKAKIILLSGLIINAGKTSDDFLKWNENGQGIVKGLSLSKAPPFLWGCPLRL